MAKNTNNLNLVLPAYSDSADVSVLNSNFQKIDNAFGSGGLVGPQGPAEYTPVRGIDYYTESDKAKMVNLVPAATGYADTFTNGVEFYVTRNTNRFSVSCYKQGSAESYYAVKNSSFPYVAIKYT